jgi:hypothetical protein
VIIVSELELFTDENINAKWWFYVDEKGERVIHRDGAPAIIYKLIDSERWYQHGKLHRDDGPAIRNAPSIRKDIGYNVWYQNGKKHREDGPAVVLFSGEPLYYLFGEEYKFEEFLRLTPADDKTRTMLALKHI